MISECLSRSHRIGWLKRPVIGIAGAGGVGSNLAYLLVKAGFDQLRVIDFDRVEPSNLNRQYYFPHQVGLYKVEALKKNLLVINRHLKFEAVVAKISPGEGPRYFADCHVIAECLDRSEEKSNLVASLLPLGKFIVAVSGIGGVGDSDRVGVHRIRENLILVGDLTSAVEKYPPFAPKVTLAAAMMADVILHYAVSGY